MKKKILVVENDENNRQLMTDILIRYGYLVIQATNGR